MGRELVNFMVCEYNLKGIDFMGYKLKKNNPYTYHHIIKRCHGGEKTLENGAILTKIAHEYLHIIESRDLELYNYINIILKEVNEQHYAPTSKQLLAIDYILRIFEHDHINDRTSKNKPLMKQEYIEGRNKNGRIFRID